jgi:hypothetical protein
MRHALAVVCAVAGCTSYSPPPSTKLVTLVGSGAEPRRALAYTADDRDQTVRVAVGGMIVVLDWRHASDELYRFHIDHLDIDAPAGVQKEMVAMMGDGRGGAWIDTQGRASVGLARPGEMTPLFLPLLDELSVPLPSEPVGVGASWHMIGPSAWPDGGKLGATYHLIELTAIGAKVEWDVTDVPPSLTPRDPKITAHMHGTAKIEFADVLPAEASLATTYSGTPEADQTSEAHVWMSRVPQAH